MEIELIGIEIVPDWQDLRHVARERGGPRSPEDAAEHYRFAQARKLIRLYEHGRLPLALMRQMDEIRAGAYLRNVGE